MGFDVTGKFLLIVTHSGRGVFAFATWEPLARDPKLAYPEAGKAIGIGPIDGQIIDVFERDERKEQISMKSPDGRFQLLGDSEGIVITELPSSPNSGREKGVNHIVILHESAGV
jgi:hypothetical protein